MFFREKTFMLLHVMEELAVDACSTVVDPLIASLKIHCIGDDHTDADEDAVAADETDDMHDEQPIDDTPSDTPNAMELLKMMARALGSISCNTDAASLLLEKGVVAALVAAVKAPLPHLVQNHSNPSPLRL